MKARYTSSSALCSLLMRCVIVGTGLASLPLSAQEAVTVRTPATPLVTHDPYFSIWSFDDTSAKPTRHWTGAEQQLSGWVRVDGKLLRFLGGGRGSAGEVMTQTSRSIWPTRTIYEYESAGVHLTATFLTPALPHDLDVLSRPVTYLAGRYARPTAASTRSSSISMPRAACGRQRSAERRVGQQPRRRHDSDARRHQYAAGSAKGRRRCPDRLGLGPPGGSAAGGTSTATSASASAMPIRRTERSPRPTTSPCRAWRARTVR